MKDRDKLNPELPSAHADRLTKRLAKTFKPLTEEGSLNQTRLDIMRQKGFHSLPNDTQKAIMKWVAVGHRKGWANQNANIHTAARIEEWEQRTQKK